MLAKEIISYTGLNKLKCVLTNNATSAIQITMQALELPKDKRRVLTQLFTFPATIGAVLAAQLTPVFIDITEETWHVDPSKLRTALANDTQIGAVLLVRTLGMAQDFTEHERVCKEAGVPLIVDSAGCFGAVDQTGRTLGGTGDAEIFSFHATKPFSVGEGGAVVTTLEFAAKIKSYANFGLTPNPNGLPTLSAPGINAKMPETTAAIALALLNNFSDKVLKKRRKRASIYQAQLIDGSNFVIPDRIGTPSWQFFPVKMRSKQAAQTALRILADNGIIAKIYYNPIPFTKASYSTTNEQFLVSFSLSERIVALPIHNGVSTDIINLIVTCIRQASKAAT